LRFRRPLLASGEPVKKAGFAGITGFLRYIGVEKATVGVWRASQETRFFRQYLCQNKKIAYVGWVKRSETLQKCRVELRSTRPTRCTCVGIVSSAAKLYKNVGFRVCTSIVPGTT
jgi:hypothetical protein